MITTAMYKLHSVFVSLLSKQIMTFTASSVGLEPTREITTDFLVYPLRDLLFRFDV